MLVSRPTSRPSIFSEQCVACCVHGLILLHPTQLLWHYSGGGRHLAFWLSQSLPLGFEHFCRNFAFVYFSSSKVSLFFMGNIKIFFSLSMVNLQCHIHFRCTAKWISFVYAQSLSLVRFFVTPWATVHGVSQARILEWVAISCSQGSSWPRDQTHISCISSNGR